MKLIFKLLSFYLMPVIALANTNDAIKHYQEEALRAKAQISNHSLEAFQASSLKTQASYQNLIQPLLQQTSQATPSKKELLGANGAILFVSFSMPEPLLFSLSDEAARFGIPVVIRGLVEDDFKKTIQRFAALHKKAQKEHILFNGVSIDPIWFEQFHIDTVPALVVSQRPTDCEPQSLCPHQMFDVVYGNADLKSSLKLIADKGEAASALAKTILENGHV